MDPMGSLKLPRRRAAAAIAVAALAAATTACKPPPPAAGSVLIGCDRAGERVQVTVSSHLDPS